MASEIESPITREVRVRIVAIENVPRLGFQAHFGVAHQALSRCGIQVNWGSGAFWDQSMQNIFEETLRQPWDWLLTIDYDSLFTESQLGQLIQHAVGTPGVDALAPLQAHRARDTTLAYFGGREEVVSNGGLLQADSAHFGLTLIRAEKIRALPKPWFEGLPNDAGEWTKDQTDADIYFWRKWKEVGNTCWIDTAVRIGHLAEVVRLHDEQMKIRMMSVKEWKEYQAERDKPLEIRVEKAAAA